MASTTRAESLSLGGADIAKMRRAPTHPGEMFLEEVIKPRGRGARADIARRIGMPLARLNQICAKRRPVTADVALLFAAVSGTSPQLWLHLQANYDLWHALQTTDTSKVQPLGR